MHQTRALGCQQRGLRAVRCGLGAGSQGVGSELGGNLRSQLRRSSLLTMGCSRAGGGVFSWQCGPVDDRLTESTPMTAAAPVAEHVFRSEKGR
eukprot:273342-Chlamydomonas_euryale.AAC.7